MTPEMTPSLTKPSPNGLATVEQEIARACKEARRDRASVTLIAVSKTFDASAISPVIDAGQRVFGENRVQEAKAKWPGLMSAYPGIVLHLIGPLQSNKAKEAVALFDAIHSVDRPSICEALAKEINSQKKQPELFVQLNTGEEPQKAGVAPDEADAFIAGCREKYGLVISGLMCIPPVNEAPAPHFALTAKIAARNGLKNLSMGMSADFAIAIQLGATHVRVGSAIFGHGDVAVMRGALREASSPRSGLLRFARNDVSYANPTDTFPSTPKSTAQRSPAWIGSGGWQVPVVTTRPAFNVTPSWRNSLASQVSATPGIAEHVLAVTDELLAAHRDDGLFLDEIECAPVRRRGRAEHEQMRAGIVGDDLRGAGADEIRKSRIRNLDRRDAACRRHRAPAARV